MSSSPTTEQAVEWLTEQLNSLRQYTNATTRDQGFRQWRQDTLTVVQRIWPEQQGKWSRFRNVPFAPPSPQADERTARNSFERGFAEMRRLLKTWITELKAQGVPTSGTLPDPKLKAVPPGNGRGKKRLKDMLGFSEQEAAAAPHGESGQKSEPPRPSPAAAAKGKAPPAKSDTALAQTIADALERALGEGQAPGSAGRALRAGRVVQHPFGALADDLERLEVPVAKREAVRQALSGLARSLESGTLSWQMLQDAVALVMEYPALARRAIPLLIPYLDSAA